MRLKGFITEYNRGSRGKAITKEETIKLLETKCKKSLQLWKKDGVSLYRGMGFKADYYLIDPSTSVRTSQNTDNYYTILFDNHPSWKGYPKRSRSIICTTDENKAKAYGQAYHMFAYDGANYGVCPEADLWMSFKEMGIPSLGIVNSDINAILRYFMMDDEPIHDYKSLQKSISEISERLPSELEKFKNHELPWELQNRTIVQWVRTMDFDVWFYKRFDPKSNGFYNTKNINKIFSSGKKNKEVWTDSKSVLITQDYMIDLFNS